MYTVKYKMFCCGCQPRNSLRMVLFALFSLIIITECYAKRSKACSLEFSHIGSKCYYFSPDVMRWDDAYYECLGKNSSLAILGNAKEEKEIRNYLRRHSRNLGTYNRWIGGKFDWKNGEWVWAETGQPISFNAFHERQPADTRLLQWTCLIIDRTLMDKWSHKSCFQQNRFICQKSPRPRRTFSVKKCRRKGTELTDIEKNKCLELFGGYGGKTFHNIPAPIIQTPKPSPKNYKEYVCPPHMFIIRKRCYYFSHEKLNWNDAYWACRDNKTNLAVIQNKYQHESIKKILDSGLVGRFERWLGGLYDWKKNRWLWAQSGKPLKYHGFPFKNHVGTQFEWKSITVDPDIENMWNSRSRIEEKHYICQKRAKTVVKLGDYNTGNNLFHSNESNQDYSGESKEMMTG